MLKDLEKMMMSKKDKSQMSEQEMQAKMEVLQELLHMAQEAMGSKVKNGMDEMKKVSVMAPDQASLEKGLEMAKEVSASPELAKIEEDAEEEKESPEEKKAEELDPKLEASESEDEEDDDSLFGKRPKKNTTSSMMYDED